MFFSSDSQSRGRGRVCPEIVKDIKDVTWIEGVWDIENEFDFGQNGT